MGLIKIIKFEYNHFRLCRLLKLHTPLKELGISIKPWAVRKLNEMYLLQSSEQEGSVPKMKDPPSPPVFLDRYVLTIPHTYYPHFHPNWDELKAEEKQAIKDATIKEINAVLFEKIKRGFIAAVGVYYDSKGNEIPGSKVTYCEKNTMLGY